MSKRSFLVSFITMFGSQLMKVFQIDSDDFRVALLTPAQPQFDLCSANAELQKKNSGSSKKYVSTRQPF